MEKMIDSSKRKLKMEDVIRIAAKNTKSPYTFNQVYVSILKELTLPSAIVLQLGNTLFIAHKAEQQPRIAMFRALNADIAKNFVKNCKEMTKVFYNKYGLDTIVTQYSDPAINHVFEIIGKERPKNMGFNIRKTADGKEFQATVKLGQERA